MAHKKEGWTEELYGDAVREKLLEFAEAGWESIPEDEREKWFSRFKFWGIFHQRSGQEGYFMMRLTNANGRLEPGQLRAIGEVAREYARGPTENPEFCSLALVETKARMATMLRWLRDNVELPDDVDQLKPHFSGCTADCGHANTADVGLLGMRARKDGEMVEAVDIGVGGGVGEEPAVVDYVRQRVPADEAPGAIRTLIEAFAERRSEGQTFREWADAIDSETLAACCEPVETSYEDPCLADGKQSWYSFATGDRDGPGREAASSDD